MKKPPVSLQMWSVRDVAQTDFRKAVREVARIGYAGVELAGYGELTAAQANEVLREAGLAVSGMHVVVERLRNEPARVAEEALLLGSKDVICPWIDPKAVATRAQAEAFGEELGRVGAEMRAHGLRFGFHNHGHEIGFVDGRSLFEWILDAAEPRNLAAEVDVYWVHWVKQKPADFLRRLGARAPLLHLKDGHDGGRQCELGRGAVDFDAVFATAEAIGAVEWYVVEQEEYDESSLLSARLSFEWMKAKGKA